MVCSFLANVFSIRQSSTASTTFSTCLKSLPADERTFLFDKARNFHEYVSQLQLWRCFSLLSSSTSSPELSSPPLSYNMTSSLSSFADVPWWVGFLLPQLVGLSPLRDWLKHLFPRLWPKEGNEAIPNPDAEVATSDTALTRLDTLLTDLEQLSSDIKKAQADLHGWIDRVKEREDSVRVREERVQRLVLRFISEASASLDD